MIDIVIPDSVEPVVGWRAWRVSCKTHRLCSATLRYKDGDSDSYEAWNFRQPIVAKCLIPAQICDHITVDSPHEPCSCGVYLANNFFEAYRYLEWNKDSGRIGDKEIYVIGQAYGWGKVIEYTSGYRAQYAYPKSLFYLPQEHFGPKYIDNFKKYREFIEEGYGIPIIDVPTFKDVPFFRKVFGKNMLPDVIRQNMDFTESLRDES